MPQFFIDRPVFAWWPAVLITLGGLLALTRLPSEAYPQIAPPQVAVTTTYPGASAATVETTVTQVIEQQLTGLDNLLYFTSQSASDGSANITLTFQNGTNPDIAAVQTQNRGNVRVGAVLEGERDVRGAVRGRLRGEVQEVVEAGELLLDDLGDGGLHRGSTRAGISRSHRDLWRGNLRVGLRGQPREREQSPERDEDGGPPGKHRAIDEKLRHGPLPSRRGRRRGPRGLGASSLRRIGHRGHDGAGLRILRAGDDNPVTV